MVALVALALIAALAAVHAAVAAAAARRRITPTCNTSRPDRRLRPLWLNDFTLDVEAIAKTPAEVARLRAELPPLRAAYRNADSTAEARSRVRRPATANTPKLAIRSRRPTRKRASPSSAPSAAGWCARATNSSATVSSTPSCGRDRARPRHPQPHLLGRPHLDARRPRRGARVAGHRRHLRRHRGLRRRSASTTS